MLFGTKPSSHVKEVSGVVVAVTHCQNLLLLFVLSVVVIPWGSFFRLRKQLEQLLETLVALFVGRKCQLQYRLMGRCIVNWSLCACRHTQQTGTPLAAPQSGEPSKAASDSQDQASGQAPSAAAPASLQVSKPEVEAVVEAPAQVSKEDRIAAAREKYLARKRQKTA